MRPAHSERLFSLPASTQIVGLRDGRGEADSLNISATERDQALEQAGEMRTPVIARKRVDLVDDNG